MVGGVQAVFLLLLVSVAVRRDLHGVCNSAVGAEDRGREARATRVICDRVGGGMRGVLSLAAAFSLPYTLPGGKMFPQRSIIIYLAFCLIIATLVLQGLSLPWLIRKLGLSDLGHTDDEEQEARRVMLREALVHLARKRSKNRDQSAMFGELIASYQRRLDAMPAEREEQVKGLVDHSRRSEAVLAALQVEREALIRLRNEGRIDDEVLRTLQRELDFTESRVHTGSILTP